MPAPKLTRIIDAVAARLADIQVANGYYTDMGLRVILDFRAPQSEELPAVSVFLGERAAESNLGCDARVEMLINVIGYVAKDGGQAYLLGDEILADIQRAMETEDETLGGLLRFQYGMAYAADEIFMPEVGADAVGARVSYTAPHVRKYGDPEIS